MKTEIYILTIHNPLTGKIINTARPTRREVCQLLLDKVTPDFWFGLSRDTAQAALKAERYDEFDAVASNLMMAWEITKVPLEVNDPKIAKLKVKMRDLKRKLRELKKGHK